MALSGVTCPSCRLQDLGRRRGEECNHTSAIGSGIPGFDSSSVESCQPDSCQVVSVWVFPAVSVGIVSQQLRGMQSPAMEMTLCWDLRLFAALFLPQVLYSELPHCTPELYLLSCLPSLSLHLPTSASSGSIKPALDDSSLCLLLGSGLLEGFARAPHDMCTALVNEEFLYWNIITEGPGTEQEIQVLFSHKHLQFELAEYLDTNSLWVGILWVYLSSYIPVFELMMP